MNKIDEILDNFLNELKDNERSIRTVKKYSHDIRHFLTSKNIEDLESITKDILISYKDDLWTHCKKESSINNKLIILNKFLTFAGLSNLKLKLLKLQKKTSLDDVLSLPDYVRLIKYAEKLNKIKTLYIMKTLAGTGIRIDELKFITVEAVKLGMQGLLIKERSEILLFLKNWLKS